MTIANSAPELAPFGWYPDPAGTGLLRWWDGSAWTERMERPRPEVQSAMGYSTPQSTDWRSLVS